MKLRNFKNYFRINFYLKKKRRKKRFLNISILYSICNKVFLLLIYTYNNTLGFVIQTGKKFLSFQYFSKYAYLPTLKNELYNNNLTNIKTIIFFSLSCVVTVFYSFYVIELCSLQPAIHFKILINATYIVCLKNNYLKIRFFPAWVCVLSRY